MENCKLYVTIDSIRKHIEFSSVLSRLIDSTIYLTIYFIQLIETKQLNFTFLIWMIFTDVFDSSNLEGISKLTCI